MNTSRATALALLALLALVSITRCRATPGNEVIDRGSASPRIHNGGEAMAGQFPFVVQLFTDHGTMCTGSLIANNMVLTAAHCFFEKGSPCRSRSEGDVRVRAGVVNLSEDGLRDNPGQVLSVEEIIIYPEYDNERVYHDIAILRLTGEMQLNANVGLVKTSYDNIPANTNVTFVGWGATSPDSSVGSANLLFVPAPGSPSSTTTFKIVARDYPPCVNFRTLDGRFTLPSCCTDCILSSEVGGACSGDSGSPQLIGNTPDTYQQISVESFGSPCGGRGVDGVTRLYGYQNWIECVKANGTSCSCDASTCPIGDCSPAEPTQWEYCEAGAASDLRPFSIFGLMVDP